MEKSIRFQKKIKILFWSFIGGLPILIFIFNVLCSAFTQSRIVIELSEFNYTPFYNLFSNISNISSIALTNTCQQVNFIQDSFVFDYMMIFLQTLLGVNSTAYMIVFIADCLTWYIVTTLIHFSIDLLMWPLNACKSIASHKLGDYE